MQKLTSIPFSRVPKMEFRAVVTGVVAIVAKYNPQALHIDGSYNLVTQSLPLLKNLRKVYKKHQKTVTLISLRKERKNLAAAIVTQVKAAKKANLAAQQSDLEMVIPFVEEHLGDIQSENSVAQSESLKVMFDALDGHQTMSDSFAALGLSPYVEQLRTVQESIIVTFDSRNTSRSTRPRMKTNAVKVALTEPLMDLLNDIEISSKKYPALDYTPLIDELNEFLKPFVANIKAKSTRSKNAKEAKNATDATAPTASAENVA